jgi:hypothetical protein
VELVEAKQPRFARERNGRKLDWILARMLAALHLLPEPMIALVHIDREFAEMPAAFSLHRARFDEQIHQHRFAAPDIAVDIDAFKPRLLFLAAGEQLADRRGFPRQGDSRRSALQAAPAFRRQRAVRRHSRSCRRPCRRRIALRCCSL